MKNTILELTPDLRYFIFQQPIKMNTGVDYLIGLVTNYMDTDPQEGEVYIFVSKSHKILKLLHYNNGVFTMYVRKIRKGVFVYPKWDFSRQEYPIDWPRLRLLINGYKVVQK